MSFDDAVKPFHRYAYDRNGYVDRAGQVRNGGLGCSSYVSVVLHRMCYGDEWLDNYDLRVHQWYGHRIAEFFSLKRVGVFDSPDLLDKSKCIRLVRGGRLPPGLYLFDARSGENGHVGFVRVQDTGELCQSHYSSLSQYEGLARGDFRDWLSESLYRNAKVTMYAIPGVEEALPH